MLTASEIIAIAQPILSRIPGIITAYLYGSYANQTAREESDIDVAVDLVYDSQLKTYDLIKYEIDLSNQMKKQVQLSVLPRSQYLVFQHQVVTQGKIILDLDPKSRLERLTNILNDYQDFKMMYRQHQKQEIKQFAKDIQK